MCYLWKCNSFAGPLQNRSKLFNNIHKTWCDVMNRNDEFYFIAMIVGLIYRFLNVELNLKIYIFLLITIKITIILNNSSLLKRGLARHPNSWKPTAPAGSLLKRQSLLAKILFIKKVPLVGTVWNCWEILFWQ